VEGEDDGDRSRSLSASAARAPDDVLGRDGPAVPPGPESKNAPADTPAEAPLVSSLQSSMTESRLD